VTPGQRQPSSSQPEAVMPQEVRRPPRPTKKTAPTRVLQPGDLICGDCGEGNPPNRRFCSRCGASLVTAEKVHIPWWKRIFRRRPKQAAAGGAAAAAGTARKRRRNALAKILPLARRVIAVVLLVGGVVYASWSPFRTWVNTEVMDGKSRVMSVIHPQYTPVHPFQVTAGAELKDHPGSALSDGFTNTFWAAPVGDKAFVTLKFDHPVDVSRALIRIGISGNFQGSNRPHDLHIVFSTGKTQDLNLDDKADPQEVKFKAGGKITSMEIHVASLYRAPSDSVAITEVELFSKK
jgi:zinc-ribbon domain